VDADVRFDQRRIQRHSRQTCLSNRHRAQPREFGGPLLDSQRHMIGINTAMARVAKDGTPIMNINFAVESNVAQQWLKQHGVVIAYANYSPDPMPTEAQAPVTSSFQPPTATPIQR
jgi:hypothetical protein